MYYAVLLLLASCASHGTGSSALIGDWTIEMTKHDHHIKKTMRFEADGVYQVVMKTRMAAANADTQWREHTEIGTWRIDGDTLFTHFATLDVHPKMLYTVRSDTLFLGATYDGTTRFVPHLREIE